MFVQCAQGQGNGCIRYSDVDLHDKTTGWRPVRGKISAFILLDSGTSKVKSLLVRKNKNPNLSRSNLFLN